MLNINFVKTKTLSVVAKKKSFIGRFVKPLVIAIASCVILGDSYSLSSNAQNVTLESDSLTNIDTQTNQNWYFDSENESISVKDEIQKLEDYSISESETDIELNEEEPKWGNRGDVEDTSVEIEVYDY